MRSPTGSGKTLAFLLPIIRDLSSFRRSEGCLRAIVLSPTRELCIQIAAEIKRFSKGRRIKVKDLCRFLAGDLQPEYLNQLNECGMLFMRIH